MGPPGGRLSRLEVRRKALERYCSVLGERIELVRYVPLDLTPLITDRFSFGEIEDAYQRFGNQGDGVVNAAAAR